MNTTDSSTTGLTARAANTPGVQSESSTVTRPCLLGFIAILIGAFILRAWNMDATFESSDQAAMPYLVQHSYGVKWLFAHDYGPVLAILQRTFAEIGSRAGLPICEASYRLPVASVSLAQVALTFALLRRLRCPRADALVGTLCCAILPTLVTDAHYAWGYLTVWLFTGSLALWATLAYLDDHRAWQLPVAGLALCAHCLCNCYAFGLPITLLVVWWLSLRGKSRAEQKDRIAHRGKLERATACYAAPEFATALPTTFRAAIAGWGLPCLIASVAIALMWLWTGAGQLGRLVAKHQSGTTGWRWDQMLRLPAFWSGQFGYFFGFVSAIGLIYGSVLMTRKDRRGLLAVWALTAAVPLVLLADWSCIGYPGSYLIETVYSGGLLGTLVICSICRKLAAYPRTRSGAIIMAALLFAALAISSADDCLAGGRLARFTGVNTGWGTVRPDTGVKAAGWYVRKHVPLDTVIMTLHANYGMELPVAEFYLGRKVLATYDLPLESFDGLLENMQADIDMLIVDGQHRQWGDSLADFERVVTLRNRTIPVRYIYARRALSLPRIDEEVSVLNKLYGRPHHVPIPLPAGHGFDQRQVKYQRLVQQLKSPLNGLSRKPGAP